MEKDSRDRRDLMKFYIDCEFDGHGGQLLSLAMVRSDGLGIHIKTHNEATDLWVLENVVPLMDNHNASMGQWIPENEVGLSIKSFIGDCEAPIIVADSPVDIGRFCTAISTGSDGGWSSTGYPLMTFEVHNVDCYPTALEDAVRHNAWWDAMALRSKLA